MRILAFVIAPLIAAFALFGANRAEAAWTCPYIGNLNCAAPTLEEACAILVEHDHPSSILIDTAPKWAQGIVGLPPHAGGTCVSRTQDGDQTFHDGIGVTGCAVGEREDPYY